jgi:hypothetical protein
MMGRGVECGGPGVEEIKDQRAADALVLDTVEQEQASVGVELVTMAGT